MPATSQPGWLMYIPAITVQSGSWWVRDRLRSFNFCMGRSIDSHQRRWIQHPRRYPIASLLGALPRQGIWILDLNRQHLRDQWQRVIDSHRCEREQFFELLQLDHVGLLAREVRKSLDLLDNRKQRALHAMGQALQAQGEMRLAFDPLLELVNDERLPDPG